ncbi:MAG: glycosyltransferase [Nitrososphaera sp.]
MSASDELDLGAIPSTFQHYVWASEYCKGKNVLELNCGSGLGASILSRVAAKVTGLDRNNEAIKYALRNCYVEGKTKFVVGEFGSPDIIDYEVLLSFNNDQASDLIRLLNMLDSSFAQLRGGKNENRQMRTYLLGLKNIDTFSNVRKWLEGSGSDSSSRKSPICYSIYRQGKERPDNIVKLHGDNGDLEDTARILFVFEAEALRNPPSSNGTKERELVSIVIPTYNRADLISQSIDSALGQSYPNVEVIVVDDGSTDNTKELCVKYGDKIRYFYKQNGGIGSALNYGIKNMEGVRFKWLSSDDVLTSDAIQVMVDHANETGAMIAYTDYDIIDNDNNFVKRFVEPHFESFYEFASLLWTRFIGNGSSIMINRSCIDEVGLFDETLRSAEDYDWWLRACLLHGYRFFHIPRTTLKYRIHGKQLTSEVKHNAYVTDEKIRNKIRQQIISANPEWWRTLVHYQKFYSKEHERRGIVRRMLRKSLLRMPESVRKRALNSWQKSMKPRIDGED